MFLRKWITNSSAYAGCSVRLSKFSHAHLRVRFAPRACYGWEAFSTCLGNFKKFDGEEPLPLLDLDHLAKMSSPCLLAAGY